jgi:hypothetical protein
MLVAGCVVLWLSGCSTTGFFYNRLDTLIPWYMGRYVELRQTQRALLDEELAALLHWHRQEELQRYVALLDDALESLNTPLTPTVITGLAGQVEAAWLRLRERALPPLLRLGETLDQD